MPTLSLDLMMSERAPSPHLTWLERWERPNCCSAFSADHGSSSVTCSRRRWFASRRSACSEMPQLAA
jgi:hypothetical protein